MKDYTQKLHSLYCEWSKELDFSDDKYSNPYYISPPEDWELSQNKIMIVGEEGYGKRGAGKEENLSIEEIQREIKKYTEIQLSNDKTSDLYNSTSAFWRRARKIKELGASVIWDNIDKIHLRIGFAKSCRLTEKDRKKLHSSNIKILQEEINILNPTIVIFFGWYKTSLKSELPDVYEELYKNAIKLEKDVYVIEKGKITYIFTWHPSFQTKDYEQKVMKKVSDTIKLKK